MTDVDTNSSRGSVSSPSAALSSDGSQAAAVWQVFSSGNNVLYSATGAATGSAVAWSSPLALSEPGRSASDGVIELAGDGTNATSIWRRNNGSQEVIQSSSAPTADDAADWTEAIDLSNAASSAFRPELGLSSNGHTAVGVWYTSDGSRTVIQASVGSITGSVPPDPPIPAPVFPPSAPLGVVAAAGDATAMVSWALPASPGTFPVTTYQVMTDAGEMTCLTSQLTCVATGLVNGQEYTFRVRALSGAGWGPWSAASNVVVPKRVITPSILVSGQRSGNARLVVVTGVTTGMVGATVAARVKLAGQSEYSAGSARVVDAAGGFTWQRRTGKKVFVYFQAGDVRSDRVVIAAR